MMATEMETVPASPSSWASSWRGVAEEQEGLVLLDVLDLVHHDGSVPEMEFSQDDHVCCCDDLNCVVEEAVLGDGVCDHCGQDCDVEELVLDDGLVHCHDEGLCLGELDGLRHGLCHGLVV